MPFSSMLLGLVAVVAGVFLLRPQFSQARLWRAVVTPLASIIGSGFLVAAPILSHVSGSLAWLAMLALCGLGMLFGSSIRFNIVQVEPTLDQSASWLTASIERLSGLALAFAYFISVAYYLNLFSAFALRGAGIVDTTWIKALTSLVLVALGAAGFGGGLATFERIETMAVGFKLAIIAGLLAALLAADAGAALTGTLFLPEMARSQGWGEIRIVLGLVVLVQGFETSRYLGDAYQPQVRVRTMLWAQWIATGVYLSFIVLATPFFTVPLTQAGGETAIIDLLRPLGMVVAPAIILAALASQLSAAVADLNGSGGLLEENLGRWISLRAGYLVTVVAALAITWAANIYEIIAYASRAFVAYYALQSLQALLAALRLRKWGRGAQFALGFGLALLVLLLAAPADV